MADGSQSQTMSGPFGADIPAHLQVQSRPLGMMKATAEHSESPASPKPLTQQLRLREFALVYMSYMCFLMGRKNYGFWLPAVIDILGIGKAEAGLLGSTQEIVYGTCALLNGVLIDMASPKHILVACLLCIALLNLAIGSTESLPVMIVIWGANGFVQSFGWPSISNIFLAWFPDPASRGAWYSLLSTCQNAGAALVPLLISSCVSRLGWRGALYAPAICCCCYALVLGALLYGSPAAVQRSVSGQRQGLKTYQAPQLPRGLARLLTQQVLLNRALWLMALNYAAISLVRTSLSDWSTVFLLEAKGLDMSQAARCLFLLETGGFVGSLVAGAMSDRFFAGRRGPIVCTASLCIAPALIGLLLSDDERLLSLCYALLGFCAFPVHVLLGLFSREVVAPNVSSSAGGFVKAIAQIGGAFAGYPLGLLQQQAGWRGVFGFLASAVGLAALATLPLWNTTAQVERQPLRCRNGTVADFEELQKKHAGGSHAKLHKLS